MTESSGRFCGKCAFAARLPGDIHQISCRGAPPSVVAIPNVVHGQVTGLRMESTFPVMRKNHPACGLWQAKQELAEEAPDKPDFAGIDLSALPRDGNGQA